MSLFKLFKSRHTKDGFIQQVRPYLQAMYRTAWRLTGSEDDAEDLLQDFLLKLYEKQVDFATLDNPQTWCLRGLYNQFIDNVRKQNRSALGLTEEVNEEYLDSLSDQQHTPHQITEHHAEIKYAEQLLQQLNADQRIILILHDIEGYTLTELETVLNAPLGTLKSRLHRARNALNEIISTQPFKETRRVNG